MWVLSSAFTGEGRTDARDVDVSAETAPLRRDLANVDQKPTWLATWPYQLPPPAGPRFAAAADRAGAATATPAWS